MQSLGGKWLLVSSSAQEKIWEFGSRKPEGRNFKFDRIRFSRTYTGPPKNWGRSFTLWHWSVMTSLGENWLLVSYSAQKKMWEFRSTKAEGQNFKFDRWFFLKGTLVEPKTVAGVSSYDTEVSWQVWHKTDSWFPIQPTKQSANFVPASQRVEISNLMGWFFLKATLVEPKTVAGVSSCHTERPWKFFGKSEYRFPIEPRKSLWILCPAKFWPSRLLKEFLPFLGRLNWKPLFRFSWNFRQPFIVTTGNCCLNFLLRELTF